MGGWTLAATKRTEVAMNRLGLMAVLVLAGTGTACSETHDGNEDAGTEIVFDATLPDAGPAPGELCPNGVVDPGEGCDPGGFAPGEAPADACTACSPPDAGPGEMPEPPPGEIEADCGCRAVPPSDPPWAFALLALGALLWRRRR